MPKKTITKEEFNELSKVMDPLDIIQKYIIEEDSKLFTETLDLKVSKSQKIETKLSELIPQIKPIKKADELENFCPDCGTKVDFNGCLKCNKKDSSNWLTNIFKYYFTSKGRIGRSAHFLNFWILLFCGFILILVFTILISELRTVFKVSFKHALNPESILLSILCILLLYGLICNDIKRLHDMNKSGWFLILLYLINLIPGVVAFNIGLFIYLIIMYQKGSLGENKYGSDPREASLKSS